MKIEKIKKLSGSKYKIEFQSKESIITFDEIILKYNIILKKEIDEILYLKILDENTFYELYDKAIKYVSIKLRNCIEIKEYLKKYSSDYDLIDRVITKLKENNILNDERYINAFIYDKANLSNWGPKKIASELEKMDFDISEINNALSKIDKEIFKDKINKIILKKQNMNHKYSLGLLKNKLRGELYNLGYEEDMISYALSNLKSDDKNIIKKEYDKLYNKLSKKYVGNELKYNIKQKLYSKGFNIELINEYLDI